MSSLLFRDFNLFASIFHY